MQTTRSSAPAPTPRLQPFGEHLWLAEGPTVDFMSFPYPTRMAVARVAGAMWVWSPIELDPALEAEVRALGEVRWIVSPNKIHHLFLPAWQAAFPDAALYAPPGLATKRADLHFAAELGDEHVAEWGEDVEHLIVHGSRAMEEVVFFHRPSATCIVGDLIQRHDPNAFAGWKRAAMQLDDLLGPEGSTPREWRATFVRRQPGREALKHILDWEPAQLVIAHGTYVAADSSESASEVIAKGLSWLSRPWPV